MPDHPPHPLRLQFISDPLQHTIEGHTEPILTFVPVATFDSQRHEQQRSKLPPEHAKHALFAANQFDLPLSEYCQAYVPQLPDGVKISTRSPQQQLFTGQTIYLFNVLVALEWTPSPRTLQQLIAAFRSASNFLYDATDGFMTFGQVVFGGNELFGAADITLLASNRYHPRSWMDGLHNPTKYTPIRVGRGVWQKNNSVLIPWDEPEGYRALVHEWGHYALNLLDEYLNHVAVYQAAPQPPHQLLPAATNAAPVAESYPLVVPSLSLAVESIMATLEGTSELVPQQRRREPAKRDDVRKRIAKHYPDADFSGPVNDGPYRVPFALPAFYTTNSDFAQSPATPQQEQQIGVEDVQLDHCWVYVLRQDHTGAPARLIPQGSLDARSRANHATKLPGDGFLLLGAQANDTLLFIGNDAHSGQLAVQQRHVTGKMRDGLSELSAPQLATPPSWPVVSVLPAVPARHTITGLTNTAPVPSIRVHVHGTHLPDEVWLFELGAQQGRKLSMQVQGRTMLSEAIDVAQLDGQVLLRWHGAMHGSDYFAIADYSQGGGPESSIKAPEPPMSAGSSDGNAMLFFAYTNPTAKKDHPDYSSIRIVTTRNYGGLEGSGARAAPRSYLFSMASSQAVPRNSVSPTLVVNFDQDALAQQHALQLFRYNTARATWQPAPAYQPLGAFFVAAPLLPGLNGEEPLDPAGTCPIEYYRLFLV